MKTLSKLFLFFLLSSLFVSYLFSQTKEQIQWLSKFSEGQQILYRQQRVSAESTALKLQMPIRKEYPDGTIIELQGFENNQPIYTITESNLNAARTLSTDRVWPGGSGGFSLTGSSDTLHLWDGGKVRNTHQELNGRIILGDGTSTLSDHSTHVAGTMIALGVSSSAKGMSYQAKIRAYDNSNDVSEMSTAAANRARVSNHSYGQIGGWRYDYLGDGRWAWFGTTSISEVEDYGFGYYNTKANQWDAIAINAPNYLIVKSAGNDRNEGPTGSVQHWVWSGTGWVLSSTERNRDGGPNGYDCLPYYAVAKNILTVGAVNIITAGYTGPSSVVMSSFSGWGPTDDGRIKPDVVGAGVNLYSSISTSDNAYATYSGTSMASPNVSGSVGLLLQHQRDLNGNNNSLRSSTMKGLIIHNADEAGSSNGPDYIYGWGLMNTLKVAQLMTENKNSGFNFNIREYTLSANDSISIPIPSEGSVPLKATICWTDPAATPLPISLDPPDLMLRNDLDLRIEKNGDTFYPWILDPANPSTAASTGDNFRDNVEQVFIQSPQPGIYTLKIKHKGILTGGSQVVSLIVSGGKSFIVQSPNGGENWQIGSTKIINWLTSDFSGNIKIELSRDGGGNWETIANNLANDGEENWIVNGPPTNLAMIRISGVDNSTLSDQSDNVFEISEATLTLLSPSGGEAWLSDSTVQITWNSSNLPGEIRIELSRDGGLTFDNIIDSTDNDGIENWIVIPPFTTQARIRITSIDIPTLFSISSNDFSIDAPYIWILNPSVKAALINDSTYEIKWTSYRAAPNVKIELSRDNPENKEILFESTPNDGSELWTVTGPLTDKAKLFISDVELPELAAESDGVFTIGLLDSFQYSARWNMVSLPMKMAENRKEILYPSAISDAFSYDPNSGHYVEEYLSTPKGYWLKFPNVGYQAFIGVPNNTDTIAVKKGWNLIGSLYTPIPKLNISTEPVDIIQSEIYGYDRVYGAVDTLQPGKGYWVKVKNDGLLILSNTLKK